MGNDTCGRMVFFAYANGAVRGYDVADPARPACFDESGEIIFYPAKPAGRLRLEVTCP